ncbi:putative DNA-binding protein (MmcQ/YjbR family) [Dyadobacter arcticus]|uniref:DNA-binding protein (MmcQ/YjbR family) n=2 Tax=Dyadobacter arcticus TaxID=1078754 RepID=A0ABX0UQ94_9BACT|nr:putative DNA-binding protein (MmcQ/YjbR family) [Dyadobacter arcticus]
MALSFEEATESAHFEKNSFRVGKKIFATLDEKVGRACLKLNETDQDLFCLADSTIIYPVPNKWGKQGWTLIELSKIGNEVLMDALTIAFCEVSSKKSKNSIKKSLK